MQGHGHGSNQFPSSKGDQPSVASKKSRARKNDYGPARDYLIENLQKARAQNAELKEAQKAQKKRMKHDADRHPANTLSPTTSGSSSDRPPSLSFTFSSASSDESSQRFAQLRRFMSMTSIRNRRGALPRHMDFINDESMKGSMEVDVEERDGDTASGSGSALSVPVDSVFGSSSTGDDAVILESMEPVREEEEEDEEDGTAGWKSGVEREFSLIRRRIMGKRDSTDTERKPSPLTKKELALHDKGIQTTGILRRRSPLVPEPVWPECPRSVTPGDTIQTSMGLRYKP
ncbi:hypothetical protein YB2330_006203 [Saitoella coloradoensis]